MAAKKSLPPITPSVTMAVLREPHKDKNAPSRGEGVVSKDLHRNTDKAPLRPEYATLFI